VTGYADVTDCGGVAAATWPRLPTETNFSHRICHAAPAPGADASESLHIRVICAIRGEYLRRDYGCFSSQSFWNRGSLRSGSNMGSSRSSAGVSGMPSASAPAYGIESSFCKAAIARSGSPMQAATLARNSTDWDQLKDPSRLDSRPCPVPTDLTQRPCHQGPYWSARDCQSGDNFPAVL